MKANRPVPLDDVLWDLRAKIERRMAEGFDPPEDIASEMGEYAQNEYGARHLDPVIERMAEEELAKHLARQEAWEDSTDCDRLDRIFAALENHGILARQHYWCCTNCGVDAIADEMRQARKAGRAVRGFAFYHTQDTETALDEGSLAISFGAADGSEAGAIEIANSIVRFLRRAGFRIDWTGKADRRIIVAGLDWRRRRER